jgi:hypothetical protein
MCCTLQRRRPAGRAPLARHGSARAHRDRARTAMRGRLTTGSGNETTYRSRVAGGVAGREDLGLRSGEVAERHPCHRRVRGLEGPDEIRLRDAGTVKDPPIGRVSRTAEPTISGDTGMTQVPPGRILDLCPGSNGGRGTPQGGVPPSSCKGQLVSGLTLRHAVSAGSWRLARQAYRHQESRYQDYRERSRGRRKASTTLSRHCLRGRTGARLAS